MRITTSDMADAAVRDLMDHGVAVAKETAWQAVEAALAAAPNGTSVIAPVTERDVAVVWGQLSAQRVQVSKDQVREALELIEDTTPPATASRAGVLEQAAAIVDSTILASVTEATKSNGYKADSYRYPTLAERTQAILDMARFITGDIERG